MFMTLQLLYKDPTKKMQTLNVTCAWQDSTHGFDKLYYEEPIHESGKGVFLDLSELKCWQLKPKK